MKNRWDMYFRRAFITLGSAMATLFLPAIAWADGGHSTGEISIGGLDTSSIISLGSLAMAALIGAVVYREPSIRLNGSRLLTLVLAVITAFIHLALGIMGDTLLLLNGLGYIALALTLFLSAPIFQNNRQRWRFALLAYTVITLVGYFLLHSVAEYSTFNLATKAVELALIFALGSQLLSNKADEAL